MTGAAREELKPPSEEQLNQLRDRVRSGEYQVPAHLVAAAILDFHRRALPGPDEQTGDPG